MTTPFGFLPALLVVALAAPAVAQTTYTRAATGNWSDAAGWSPAGVPGPGDTADLNGRTVTLDADATVAVLILPSLASVLSGAADLVVTDTLRWELGTSTATGTLTVEPGGILRVRSTTGLSNFKMGAGGVLLNRGLAVWEEPKYWGSEGTFVNEGVAEIPLDAAAPVTVCFSSVDPAFVNAPGGLIRRTGSGEATFSCPFDNDGTVRVEGGALAFAGFNGAGGTDTGAYEVEAGALLRFTGGTRTIGAAASVTGAGTVDMALGSFQILTLNGTYDVAATRLLPGQGRVDFNADATMPVLEMTGGQIAGSGNVNVTDALTWTGGQMGGSGTTTVQPDLDLSDATVGLRDTRTLRLEGTVTWSGETDINNSSSTVTLVNAGTVLSTGAGTRSFGNGTFRNEGLLSHDAGTLSVSGNFDNAGTVAMDGGTMALNAHSASGDTGAYAVGEGARLEFIGGFRTLAGELSGTGTVAFLGGSVTNQATWRPGASPGILAVEGNYPAGSGVLEVELGGYAPGTEHDQLAVTGTATLGGTLRVRLDGSFVPVEGDRFLVVPAAAVSGTFATLDLPDGVEGFVEATADGAELVIGTVTVANEPDADLPDAFALHDAAPNPSAGRATLRYDVPVAGPVRVAVYDLLGREVAVLVDGEAAAGRYETVLDGQGLAAGVYVVRLTAGAATHVQRLTRSH